MRVVGAPHQAFRAHLVDQLGADAVELERGLALAAPVVRRLHLEAEVGEAVLPLEVHAVECIGNPARARFTEGDADIGVTFEHVGADDGGQDVHQVHLEARNDGEEHRAAGPARVLLDRVGRHRREGVEMKRQLDVVYRLPQGLPHRVPHRPSPPI